MLSFFYYFFVTFLFFSALMVVNSRNPVHSVFFLVLVFFLGSFFIFRVKSEFLAIVFIIVYIGAIAVLFLFVVMMLNIKILELRTSYISYLPFGFLITLFVMFEFFFLDFVPVSFDSYSAYYVSWLDYFSIGSNSVSIIGYFLYTYYVLCFLVVAFILFLATIGAILLTFIMDLDIVDVFVLRKRKQEVVSQYFATYENRIIK
jgi:NADH-quinone oxidoreductase subunit J